MPASEASGTIQPRMPPPLRRADLRVGPARCGFVAPPCFARRLLGEGTTTAPALTGSASEAQAAAINHTTASAAVQLSCATHSTSPAMARHAATETTRRTGRQGSIAISSATSTIPPISATAPSIMRFSGSLAW